MNDTPQDRAASEKWGDLRVRVTSALVMAGIGLAAVVAGGVWFAALVLLVCCGIIWECWMMTRGAGRIAPEFALASAAVLLAGWGLVEIRAEHGVLSLLWLVLVVIASDVAGYFAGKSIGGPKFWPAISPKKTWSGTIAGWIAAGIVGAIVAAFTSANWAAVPLSMAAAFAGQMGDIGESWLKRRHGAKDSSALIPGHGGLFDRFDALLGATLFVVLIAISLGLAEAVS